MAKLGYKHYFYCANKSDVQSVNGLSRDHFLAQNTKPLVIEDDKLLSIDSVLPHTKVFDFGNMYKDDTAMKIYNMGYPLFDDEVIQSFYEDHIPFVVGKAGLLKAIDIYRSKLLAYYNFVVTEDGLRKSIDRFHLNLKDFYKFVDNNYAGLGSNSPSNFQEEINNKVTEQHNSNHRLTTTFKYDDIASVLSMVFDLERILKRTDWSNNTLLFYGHL